MHYTADNEPDNRERGRQRTLREGGGVLAFFAFFESKKRRRAKILPMSKMMLVLEHTADDEVLRERGGDSCILSAETA